MDEFSYIIGELVCVTVACLELCACITRYRGNFFKGYGVVFDVDFCRSVNFKFIPEQIFVSKQFAMMLLLIHLGLLFLFAEYKWSK